MNEITKAVIPVAGLGTRFLPATKATPKEMLPVVDKPAIQYVVEEAVSVGMRDVLMVTGRNKRLWRTTSTATASSNWPWRRRATPNGSPPSTSPPNWPTSTTPGRATRAAWGTPSCAPRRTWATSRSPSSSATTSSTPATRSSTRCGRCTGSTADR